MSNPEAEKNFADTVVVERNDDQQLHLFSRNYQTIAISCIKDSNLVDL